MPVFAMLRWMVWLLALGWIAGCGGGASGTLPAAAPTAQLSVAASAPASGRFSVTLPEIVAGAEPLSGSASLSLSGEPTGAVNWYADLVQIGTGQPLA